MLRKRVLHPLYVYDACVPFSYEPDFFASPETDSRRQPYLARISGPLNYICVVVAGNAVGVLGREALALQAVVPC